MPDDLPATRVEPFDVESRGIGPAPISPHFDPPPVRVVCWDCGCIRILPDMDLRETLTGVGLALDIIGVLLLWRFGLPEELHRSGAQHLILEQSDEAEASRARTYDFWARVGLGLLVIGFALQLVSVIL